MFEFDLTPMIIGHRGACAHAPENTLASFELAHTHQADAVELDAKLSKDGKVVVIHDQTVDRTTNGSGKVNQLTFDELKTLDAGVFFHKKYTGERIPTLDEVFEQVGKNLFVNVELTNYNSPNDNLIEEVAIIVKKHQMEKRVFFSSFLPKNLRRVKRLLTDTPVALLCLSGIMGFFSRSGLYRGLSPIAIHPYLSDINLGFVIREHIRGRRVHAWTVNEENDLKRMFDLNVDGIFTDDPLKARKILGGR